MPARKLLAYACIYVLWGGSFLAIRELVAPARGVPGVPPFLAAGFRFTVAGAVLIAWSWKGGRATLTRRQFTSAAVLGCIMFLCLYAGLFWAEIRVASGLAAVISAMIPVWIYAGELFVLRTQRATLLASCGILLGFAGVVVLAVAPDRPGRAGGTAHNSTLAILAMLAGTICWSAGTLASRRMTLPQPQRANAGWQMFTGGLMLLALSAAAGEWTRVPPAAVLESAHMVASMTYLIVAASIISYTAYVWLIAHDAPTRVSSYAYVNPVFALLIGAAVAGERLTAAQMAGAALVVAGVFATLRAKSSRTAQRSEVREAASEAAGRQR